MRRVFIIAAVFLGILLFMNVFSFLNVNKRFVSFLNSSLAQQTQLCGSYMEGQLGDFESDLNKLLYEYNFSTIFDDAEALDVSKQSLQLFYSNYRELITNISIFDNEKNYFGLYINEHDQFVIDTFPRQRQQTLTPRDKVEYSSGKYLYHYPYFQNDAVNGNIIVEIDFDKFADIIFNFYPKGRTISWQWLLNSKSEILSKDFPQEFEVQRINEVADSIDMFAIGLIKHSFIDSKGHKHKVHSAYFPLSIFNQSLGIVFTASQSEFNNFFIYRNIRISTLLFLFTLAVVIYLLVSLGRKTKEHESLMMSEIAMRQTLEGFPVGVMILDQNNIIKTINSAAQKMLFIDRDENLIGKDFSQQFLLSNKYLLKEEDESLEKSDYLTYEREGVETVIFKVEEECRVGGQKLNLIGLIDVSAIERSRKQELAANRAKSEFLALMSHEIRTPMNGILGMVSNLLEAKLPPDEDEKVKIIKKSSGLLMTIINDILDLSKIEAGKMLLEEIPFMLREEVSHVIDLFTPLAEEKGIKIETEIMAIVPERLIGDPFRLRQVISNLLSNAIKFTADGRIVLGIDITEDYLNSMQLLFWIEDTGVGISEEKIKSIFASYNQTQGSVSRKFGGTGLGTAISKQLVELMNGEIWVESPSRISHKGSSPGTRFSFTIQVHSNEKIKKSYNFDSIKRLNQISVLYLTKESNPDKNSVNKILNGFGLNIVTKIYQESTIDTVLHHLHVKKDLYQLVILSDKEGHDGFSLAKKIKDEGLSAQFPCIMVCSNDKTGNYKLTKKYQFDYYLIEPFESKEIFDILKEVFPGVEDFSSLTSTLNSLPAQLSILLVEDNLINQKVAQAIFKNIGYEIEMAINGIEAISRVKEKDYDIIFMDLFMPEMDGFEAANTLRMQGFKKPIIAMSADADDQRKADSVVAGMDEYLVKPAKVESVKQLLIKLFSHSV